MQPVLPAVCRRSIPAHAFEPSARCQLGTTAAWPVAAGVDLTSVLAFPNWTGRVFALAGLCLLILGLMAWLSSHRLQRRAWGRWFTITGSGLFVVGTAWGTFLDLLRYVLG